MKQKLIPALSILIGILAFWFSQQYLQARARELKEKEREVLAQLHTGEIVVAKRDVPANTVIRREDLGTYPIPKGAIGRNHILPDEAHFIFGKKALYTLKRLAPVQWSDVDIPYRPTDGLAATISPPDLGAPSLRAVSISVSGAASVSGLVQPNDRVDVLGTFSFPRDDGSGEYDTITLTVLQDVTVLATGQRLANERVEQDARRRAAQGYNAVTLEVTPREAELLVFAEQSRGTLSLSLRNPADVRYERELPSVNFEHLKTKLPDYNRERQEKIRKKPRSLWEGGTN